MARQFQTFSILIKDTTSVYINCNEYPWNFFWKFSILLPLKVWNISRSSSQYFFFLRSIATGKLTGYIILGFREEKIAQPSKKKRLGPKFPLNPQKILNIFSNKSRSSNNQCTVMHLRSKKCVQLGLWVAAKNYPCNIFFNSHNAEINRGKSNYYTSRDNILL